MPSTTEIKFLRGTLSHCFKIMPISLFFTLFRLRASNIAFINDQPAKSPDVNPTEHLWDNFDQRVSRRPIPSSNVIQQRHASIHEWNNIPQSKINTIICSMRQRYQTVLHAEGGHIRY